VGCADDYAMTHLGSASWTCSSRTRKGRIALQEQELGRDRRV